MTHLMVYKMAPNVTTSLWVSPALATQSVFNLALFAINLRLVLTILVKTTVFAAMFTTKTAQSTLNATAILHQKALLDLLATTATTATVKVLKVYVFDTMLASIQ